MTSSPPNPWRPERINLEGLHSGGVMSTLAPLLDGGQRTKVLVGRQCGPKTKGEPIPDRAQERRLIAARHIRDHDVSDGTMEG
jgi:hypothetical protein